MVAILVIYYHFSNFKLTQKTIKSERNYYLQRLWPSAKQYRQGDRKNRATPDDLSPGQFYLQYNGHTERAGENQDDYSIPGESCH